MISLSSSVDVARHFLTYQRVCVIYLRESVYLQQLLISICGVNLSSLISLISPLLRWFILIDVAE